MVRNAIEKMLSWMNRSSRLFDKKREKYNNNKNKKKLINLFIMQSEKKNHEVIYQGYEINN